MLSYFYVDYILIDEGFNLVQFSLPFCNLFKKNSKILNLKDLNSFAKPEGTDCIEKYSFPKFPLFCQRHS